MTLSLIFWSTLAVVAIVTVWAWVIDAIVNALLGARDKDENR